VRLNRGRVFVWIAETPFNPSTTHYNKVAGIARSAGDCAPFNLGVSPMMWRVHEQPNSIPTSFPRLPIREIMDLFGLEHATSAGKPWDPRMHISNKEAQPVRFVPEQRLTPTPPLPGT
jgi:hypothetical protein